VGTPCLSPDTCNCGRCCREALPIDQFFKVCEPYRLTRPLCGNSRETIAGIHVSFAVLFSVLFSGYGSNQRGATRSIKKWDAVKQSLLT
jgi:hypothetical protein